MALINNKDVLQSYILTTAKYDFSVYEKRIIYRLVELAQCEIKGVDFRKDCRKIEHDLFGLVNITLPIRDLLNNEEDKNYTRIKDALLRLKNKSFEYEDEEIWQSISIIAFPDIKKRSSTVSFTIHPKIWDCMLDFSKGFRKYELQTAMSFESVYSMRFYELLSGQKYPLSYGFEDLKAMFQIEGKYKQVNDFLRYIVEPAKKELDEKSPYSFDYKINKTGRKFTSITLFPMYQPEHRDSDLERKDLQKQISPSWDLSKNTLDYLRNGFLFTPAEIKQNIDLFKKAQSEIQDFIYFMSQVKPRANRAKNPKGYLINSIKKELNM